MKIARRFNAGNVSAVVQVPKKGRLKSPFQFAFQPSLRGSSPFHLNPALKRWAIVGCPSGTAKSPRRLVCEMEVENLHLAVGKVVPELDGESAEHMHIHLTACRV